MFPGLNDSQAKALVDTARAIGTDPQYLWELINFESGHDPLRKNPLSSARGLIQFMDATAVSMGYPGGSAELVAKFPTYEAQMLGPVTDYFTRVAPTSKAYTTRQALYMKVFYPIAMNVSPDTAFEDLQKQHGVSQANIDKFKAQNPGIVYVSDYVNKTLRLALAKPTSTNIALAAGGGGAVLLALAAFVYFSQTS